MKTILQLLTGGVIGFSFIYIAAFAGIEWTLNQIGIVILTLILSFPIHIILHELGHVLFGYTQGMKLMNMSVGPLVIERYKGRWHFHYSPAILAYAGRAMMFFPEQLPKEKMKNKLIIFLLGGVVINAITGGLFLLGGLFLENAILVIFGMMGLFLGLANSIPEYNKAVSTDGFAIKQLTKDRVDESLMINTYALLTESELNDHPTEWSTQVIQDLSHAFETNEADSRTKVLLQQLSYYYLPDYPEEIIRLGKRYAFAERGKKSDLLQDIADIYYTAALFFKGDLVNNDKVRETLEQIGKLDPITYSKKLAFLHILDGDGGSAVKELENAFQQLESWNTLYLRGEEEKQHIRQLVKRITEGNQQKVLTKNGK